MPLADINIDGLFKSIANDNRPKDYKNHRVEAQEQNSRRAAQSNVVQFGNFLEKNRQNQARNPKGKETIAKSVYDTLDKSNNLLGTFVLQINKDHSRTVEQIEQLNTTLDKRFERLEKLLKENGGGGSGSGLGLLGNLFGGGAKKGATGVTGEVVKGGSKWGSRLGKVGSFLGGKGLPVVGGVVAGATDYMAGGSAGHATSTGVGSVAGGLAGMKLGAMAGGAIGSIIPGAGTAVGAGVGGFVGGVGGSILGSEVGGRAWDAASSVVSTFKDWLVGPNGAWETTLNAVKRKASGFDSSSIRSIVGTVGTFFGGIVTSLTGAAQSMWNALMNKLKGGKSEEGAGASPSSAAPAAGGGAGGGGATAQPSGPEPGSTGNTTPRSSKSSVFGPQPGRFNTPNEYNPNSNTSPRFTDQPGSNFSPTGQFKGPNTPARGAGGGKYPNEAAIKAAMIKQGIAEGLSPQAAEHAANAHAGQAISESGLKSQFHDAGKRLGYEGGYHPSIYGADRKRGQNMVDWITQQGLDPNNPMHQGQWMIHEAMSKDARGNYKYPRSAKAMMSGDPNLPDILTKEFEAPASRNDPRTLAERRRNAEYMGGVKIGEEEEANNGLKNRMSTQNPNAKITEAKVKPNGNPTGLDSSLFSNEVPKNGDTGKYKIAKIQDLNKPLEGGLKGGPRTESKSGEQYEGPAKAKPTDATAKAYPGFNFFPGKSNQELTDDLVDYLDDKKKKKVSKTLLPYEFGMFDGKSKDEILFGDARDAWAKIEKSEREKAQGTPEQKSTASGMKFPGMSLPQTDIMGNSTGFDVTPEPVAPEAVKPADASEPRSLDASVPDTVQNIEAGSKGSAGGGQDSAIKMNEIPTGTFNDGGLSLLNSADL